MTGSSVLAGRAAPLRKLLLGTGLASLLALSACATAAQQQFKGMQGSLALAGANVKVCADRIGADTPSVMAKLSFAPTAAQLADQTLPTPDEVQQVARLSAALTACYETFRAEAAAADPAMAQPIGQAIFDINSIGADLIQRRISWGEANRRLYQVSDRDGAAVRSAHNGTVHSLQAQHQAELAQRQRALEALAQWSLQQQMINAANRPVVTNCSRLGNMVNCTSN